MRTAVPLPPVTPELQFAPDERLCLLLARGCQDAAARAEVTSLLDSPLQWERFLQQARAQEVLPLVYRSLAELGFAGVPRSVRAEMTALAEINLRRNQLLEDELRRLLHALADADVAAIPLKGLHLAESLYGDRYLRTCSDQDILVKTGDVGRAFDALIAAGYEAGFRRWVLSEGMLSNSIECVLWRRERETTHWLELHWGLLLDGRARHSAAAALWAEARPGTFLGVPVYTMTAEWQLLFLATHAARHQWQGLKWLLDLHHLCISGRVDWGKAMEEAERWEWSRLVRTSLGLCHSLLETPVPEGVLGEQPQETPDSGAGASRSGARASNTRAYFRRAHLFPAPPRHASAFQTRLFLLSLIDSPGRKLRFVLLWLVGPTPAECALLPLPPRLSFLYYAVRPVAGLGRAARALLAGWKTAR